MSNEETYDTLVIGGGQAGLAVGHFLTQRKVNYVILDQNQRTGDSWRDRWDSLCLFTPSQFNNLPGMPFPAAKNYLPPKNEVADYLEEYARHFKLPVRYSLKVDCLERNSQDYQLTAGANSFRARNVIVATGPFQRPYVPALTSQLDPAIRQIHSSEYRNPAQISANSVLVVGAGNSGAEIALELSRTGKQVWVAGRDVGRTPNNSPFGRIFDGRPFWWFVTHMLTVDTPVGRKMQARMIHHGTPLGRATREEISKAGVSLTPRLAGIRDGKPQLEDERILPVEAVIWATGFQPNYHWIKFPLIDAGGYPQHVRGIVQNAPGLYFIGLIFQTGLSSSFLGGVGKDAAYIAAQVAARGK